MKAMFVSVYLDSKAIFVPFVCEVQVLSSACSLLL